jgi:hypothetical protein
MRHVVTAGFLVAAIAAYAASVGDGVVVALFAVGMVCEGVFWWRLVRDRGRSRRDATRTP